jgi:hypothetical protein
MDHHLDHGIHGMELVILWFVAYFLCGGFVFFLWQGVKEGFAPKEPKPKKEKPVARRTVEKERTVEQEMQRLARDFMRKKMALKQSCLADDAKQAAEEELDSWYMFEVARITGVTADQSEQAVLEKR